jgi:LuxR family maltose regulon positive regulatory protein
LSLQGRPDPAAFLDAFTGTHRYVLDYLSEEVLARQPEHLTRFLLETSILERLSGPLCDAVTGGADGQAMLEELDRANLFVLPLDEERRWYRFHHLFGDLLRARLQRADARRVPELHRRAADWCEQHGLVDEAIRHALASEDTLRATRLVEQHMAETLRRGEGVILERWLAALPAQVVESRPGLCMAQGLVARERGLVDSVERCLEHAERAFDQEQDPGFQVPTEGGMVAQVSAAIGLLRAELAGGRGDAEGLAGHARSALAHMSEEEPGPRLWARYLLACADWMRGRLGRAEAGFAEVLAEARLTPNTYPRMTACYTLGSVQRERGELDAALRTYREGLTLAAKGGDELALHSGEAHVGIAQVLYERNQLDEALRHVTGGIALYRQSNYTHMLPHGLVTLAWIHQATGDPAGALAVMDEACQILPGGELNPLYNPAPAERVRLLLLQGRQEEVAGWTVDRRLGGKTSCPTDDRPITSCWPGCSWPSPNPVGPSGCWSAWTPLPRPRAGPRASSRSEPCGPWRCNPPVTARVPFQCWPRRSHLPSHKASFASLPTKGSRWLPCSAGSLACVSGAASRRPPAWHGSTCTGSSKRSSPPQAAERNNQ